MSNPPLNRRIALRRIQRFIASREGKARLAFVAAVLVVCWLNPQIVVFGVIVSVAGGVYYWLD